MARTWRIGEVAERTGLTRRTLRHYDDLGLLVPSARSSSDYRIYDEADLLRLLQIQSLKALGLGLTEIAAALADPDTDATATLRSQLSDLEQRIAAEQRLADRLRSLASATERSWEDVLDAVALARQLSHPDPTIRFRAALLSAHNDSAHLFASLEDEVDPAVQEVLIWALAQQPEAVAQALARLDHPAAPVRGAMLRLLGKLRDPSTLAALTVRLDDPDPAVQRTAVNTLTLFGAAAIGPVTACLKSPQLQVRRLATDVLNRIAEEEPEPGIDPHAG